MKSKMVVIKTFLVAILLTSVSSQSPSEQTIFETLASFYQDSNTQPHILKFFTDILNTPNHPSPSIDTFIHPSLLQPTTQPTTQPTIHTNNPEPSKDQNIKDDLDYFDDVDDPDKLDDLVDSDIPYNPDNLVTLDDVIKIKTKDGVIDPDIQDGVDDPDINDDVVDPDIQDVVADAENQASVVDPKNQDGVVDLDNSKVSKITIPPDISLPPAIKDLPLDCKLCLGVSFALHRGISKTNYTFVEDLMIKLCVKLLEPRGFNTAELCQPTITLYGPYVDHLLANTRIPKLIEMCSFFNACPGKENSKIIHKKNNIPNENNNKHNHNDNEKHNNNNNKNHNNNNNNDYAYKQNNDVKEDEIIKIIQVNDLHLESLYAPNTSALCGLPACCLAKYGQGGSAMLGDYRCDSSSALIEGIIQKMSLLEPDVVILNGGVTPNKFWDQTSESQLGATSDVEKLFANKLNRVYPTFSPSDLFPGHIFSKSHEPSGAANTDKFLEHFHKTWKKLADLDQEDETNIMKTGSYSKLLFPGLRAIFFNSAYMYTFNVLNRLNHVKGRRSEVTESKEFLKNSLETAKKAKESVILSLHHVMGTSDFITSESKWLQDLLLQYSQSLVLVINGHTHYNEFRVLYDDAGKAQVVTLVAPSVSSNNHRNPALRLYKINKKTYQLLDYQQYFLDLAKFKNVQANKVAENIVELYSAKKEYQLSDLSPSSWHNLISRFESDSALLLKHVNHYSSDARKLTSVGPLQRHRHLCRLKNAHYGEFKKCLKSFEITPPTIRPNLATTTLKPTTTTQKSSGRSLQFYDFVLIMIFIVFVIHN